MWRQLDGSNEKWTSTRQVDNDRLEFHRIGDCAGWYRVLIDLSDADHQTTATMESCATAISVPTYRVEARDLWGGALLAELRLVDQRHNGVLCHYYLDPDVQCRSQGFVGWGPPGRASLSGSAPQWSLMPLLSRSRRTV